MFYYNYVLKYTDSKNNFNIYIGYCENLKVRLKEHLSRSVFTTKNYIELELIYFEGCLIKKDARIRELQLKTGFGRGYLKRRLKTYLEARD